ncbi:hypothetical protein MMC15_004717 [Xylographa vitiligo]|nr:hypothetical protein [Xylographa vitiligo]
MDTTTPYTQLLSPGKPPLLTRIRNRLRDARDEYVEHIEAGQTRATAETPPQKQSTRHHPQRHGNKPTEMHGALTDARAALTTKNLELLHPRDTDAGHERKAKDPPKRRHHNRHQDPDPGPRRKHTPPSHHGKRPRRKHKPPYPHEAPDQHHLVSRLVRRLEKDIASESAQASYLHSAAQQLFRLADEKGKRAGSTVPSADNAAEGAGEASRDAGPTDEFVEAVAEELGEARWLEEGIVRKGGRRRPEGFVRGGSGGSMRRGGGGGSVSSLGSEEEEGD